MAAVTARSHVQEMEGEIAAVGGRRGGVLWMEGCQRIREMIKERRRNPHDAPLCLSLTLSLSLFLSLPPLHDSSINGDTLVAAGQSGLTLLSSQSERWTFALLSHSQRTDKWQVEGLTRTRCDDYFANINVFDSHCPYFLFD